MADHSLVAGGPVQTLPWQGDLSSVAGTFREVAYLHFNSAGPRARFVFPAQLARLGVEFKDLILEGVNGLPAPLAAWTQMSEELLVVEASAAPSSLIFKATLNGKTLEILAPQGPGFAPQAAYSGVVSAQRLTLPEAFALQRFAVRGANLALAGTLVRVFGKAWSPAQLKQKGTGVGVSLEIPLPLVEVKVEEFIKLAVHRLDGQALAAEATTHLVFSQISSQISLPDKVVLSSQVKQDAKAKPHQTQTSQHRQSKGLSPLVPFVGADFVLQPATDKLKLDQVHSLKLSSIVSGPRLGLARANHLDEAVFFWRGSAAGKVELGQQLAEAANRIAAELEPGSDLDLVLVVAADQACSFAVSQLALPHHVQLPLFAPAQGKLNLTFTGSGAQEQQVPLLALPPGQLVTANLELDVSFNGVTHEATPAPAGQKSGILVRQHQWTTTTVSAPADALIGVQLSLRAQSAQTVIEVELREDHGGSPSGSLLAKARISVEPGRTQAINALFETPVVLDTRKAWLLLRAAEGLVSWDTLSGQGSVGVLAGADDPLARTPQRLIQGNQASQRWLVRAPAQQPAFAASLDGRPLSFESLGKDRYRCDLGPVLHGQNTPASQLTLASSARGRISLYPIDAEFIP